MSFLIPAVVGIAVDSITLILDASASLVILVVALLMNTSIKKVHQPPDEIFNFGYERYEPLTVAVQGGLIIATCAVRAKFAIQEIINAKADLSIGEAEEPVNGFERDIKANLSHSDVVVYFKPARR